MSDILAFFAAQLHGNEFFSGAALAGVLLACLNWLRIASVKAAKFASQRLLVSMTVHSEDPMYVPIAKWLKDHRFDAFAQSYRLRTDFPDDDAPQPAAGSEREPLPTVLGPDYGTYFFRHDGRWLWVHVAKEGDATGQGSSRRAQTREFLTIRYLGLTRTRLDALLADVEECARKATRRRVPIFAASSYGGWGPAGSLARSDGPCPVVLADGVLENLTAEIDEFFQQRAWYAERGIPFRRGYLLHGPPGTGKTSLVRYLARKYGLAVYSVDAAGYMNPDFGAAMRMVPPRSIILFEDIDCHDITKRKPRVAKPGDTAGSEGMFAMNIGTLLNAIDGLNPAEQVLIFMTSNDPDALDAALTRPGRIDRKIHLDLCTPEHGLQLFAKFFPDAGDVVRHAVRAAIPDRVYSPADLQEIFITAKAARDVIPAIAERTRNHGSMQTRAHEVHHADA